MDLYVRRIMHVSPILSIQLVWSDCLLAPCICHQCGIHCCSHSTVFSEF